MVALSGRDEAYYADYAGAASEFVAAAKYGFLYQGQFYRWQKATRGVPGLDLAPSQFVHFLENHDQVANSFHGDRLQRVASVRRVRAMTALLLLGPQTPMLFQGQEFGASTPFLYFADHGDALMRLVWDGRARFLSQFRSIAAQLPDTTPPDPGEPATFVRSKLDHTERMKHAEIYALHRDLISLRRNDPVLSQPRPGSVDGAALSVDAFVLRFFGEQGDDRLLVMNFGRPLHLFIMPEPLLAPPWRGRWQLLWSSDDGRDIPLSGEEREVTGPKSPGETIMRDFRLELGLPVWEFEVEGIRLEKRVVLPYGQNTVYVSFRLMNAARATLTLRPFIHFRSYEGTVKSSHPAMQCTQLAPSRLEIQAEGTLPPLRLLSPDAPTSYTEEMATLGEVAYRVEKDRGYEWVGEVKSPGAFQLTLSQDQPATLIASTELWAAFERIPFADAQEAERRRRRDLLGLAKAESDNTVERLVLAADQFVITPVGRPEDAARAKALGDETRTVIAGYHWFTDWGRDTMISLEGLTLATGRYREAGYILRTFAHYVRDGLIPNMFPDGANEGLYHTADATLWFFHAIDRYVKKTADRRTLDTVLPRLREIIACHVGGTRFGIGMDPSDSLLRHGAEGYQLTWMDAKVDGWGGTPRRGKAVEINALWYNAVRLLASFEREAKNAADAEKLDALAAVIRESFNKRFWNPEAGHLFDVIDGDGGVSDPACRPNQLLSISLEHPVLDESRWNAVIEVVRQRLGTPAGPPAPTPPHPGATSLHFGDRS